MTGPTALPPQWRRVSRLPGLEGRIPSRPRGTVLLTTVGSLGDLYPLLSLARALEEAGMEPRLALSPDDCEVAEDWGLVATPVGPTQAEVCRRLGVTRDQIADSVLRDPAPMLRDVAIPMIETLAPQLDRLAEGADVVAATAFALSAPITAERLSLPFVPLVLQPLLLFSAVDPPRGGPFRLARPDPRGPVRAWNRVVMRLGRWELGRRLRRPLDDARARLGLPPQPGTPILDHAARVPLRLGLWDPEFAPAPSDARDLEVAGFPPPPVAQPLDPALDRWIEDGPPVAVITLGSIAQQLGAPRFWEEAVGFARTMGLRAVLLHGAAAVPEASDVAARPFAPHAALFHRAAVVVHHGGIGTTAEALRAGVPQIVAPVGGDQVDNAYRLRGMGVAGVVPAKSFTAARAAEALHRLLKTFDHHEAAALGDRIRARDGAAQAALHLARVALSAR